jgi:MFS family permease
MSKQLELLRARRFLPLLLTQTLGAFNDNLFKSAFIMLITYGAAAGPDPGIVAALAGSALIAPFFLFSATAGELADRFERSRLLQILKGAELVAVFGAVAALLAGNLLLSLVLLFVLGTQVALSSPVKYALLPQHLATPELVDGNALMEAGTFLSILAGTIAGGVAVAIAWGPAACCLLAARLWGSRFCCEPVDTVGSGSDACPAGQLEPSGGYRRDLATGVGAARDTPVDPWSVLVLARRGCVAVAAAVLRQEHPRCRQ